jgi:hypothetical protein
MTKPRALGRAPNRPIGDLMGSENLMNVEISVVIARAQERIEDHLRYIQENSRNQAVQKVANVHLAKMLSSLKRLENYRDAFR